MSHSTPASRVGQIAAINNLAHLPGHDVYIKWKTVVSERRAAVARIVESRNRKVQGITLMELGRTPRSALSSEYLGKMDALDREQRSIELSKSFHQYREAQLSQVRAMVLMDQGRVQMREGHLKEKDTPARREALQSAKDELAASKRRYAKYKTCKAEADEQWNDPAWQAKLVKRQQALDLKVLDINAEEKFRLFGPKPVDWEAVAESKRKRLAEYENRRKRRAEHNDDDDDDDQPAKKARTDQTPAALPPTPPAPKPTPAAAASTASRSIQSAAPPTVYGPKLVNGSVYDPMRVNSIVMHTKYPPVKIQRVQIKTPAPAAANPSQASRKRKGEDKDDEAPAAKKQMVSKPAQDRAIDRKPLANKPTTNGKIARK